MLLSGPPPSPMDLNFRLLGIPVRVTPWFWLTGVLLRMNERDVPSMLIWVAAFFIAILTHEMGHAIVARAHGLDPAIILQLLGGATTYNPAAYGTRASRMWPKIQISAAGPMAGFLLAGLILVTVWLTGYQMQGVGPFGLLIVPGEIVVSARFTEFLFDVLLICIFWGIFNLLPIYPLDGGQISLELFKRFNPRDGIRQALQLSIVLAIVLAVYSLSPPSNIFMTAMFSLLAYESYQAMQFYGRSSW